MFQISLFPAIFFFFFLVIVGTDFVSNEHEDDSETEEAKDENGEENDVALLPTFRQGRVLCCHVRQVLNNRPSSMEMELFLFLFYIKYLGIIITCMV